MADKPVDAEGAHADLGFGNQYFDRWFKQKSSEQKEETFSLVLKYIEEARKKDPNVSLEVKSEKGEVKQVTPDSLAAAMYLAHGSYEAFNDQTAAGRLRGRDDAGVGAIPREDPDSEIDVRTRVFAGYRSGPGVCRRAGRHA